MRSSWRLGALVIVAGMVVVACSEAPTADLVTSRDGVASLVAPGGMLVKGYQFDAPAPRAWDRDAAALERAINAAGGRLIVSFKEPGHAHALLNHGYRADLGSAAFNSGIASVADAGGVVVKSWPALGAALVQVPSAAAAGLLKNPFVDFVDPDSPHPAGHDDVQAATPRLASYGNAELDANWSIAMMHAPEAWVAGTGGTDRVMYMSQWGIDLGHNDFPAIPTSNCSGAFGSCNGSDGYGYLGNIGVGAWIARQNNYQAVGVAPGLQGSNFLAWRLIAIGSNVWYTSAVIDGIYQGVGSGIKTLAFVQFRTDSNYASVASAVAYAWSNNVVMVGAVFGAQGQAPYPAAYSQVVGVSGVWRDRTFASSNSPVGDCSVGSGWGSPKVKIAAPYAATIATSYVPSGAGTWCGSSISTGYVAGVVSLIHTKWPTWTATQVRDRLLSTAADGTGDAAHLGSGIVNANAAITLGGTILGPGTVQPFATCSWTASGSGGNGPYSYAWTAGGSSGTGQYIDYTNSAINGSSFGVVLTVTDATGSSVDVSRTISVSSSAPPCTS